MTLVIQLFVYPENWPDHLLWGSILPTRARLCWLVCVCVGWQGGKATSASFGGLDGLSFNDRPQPLAPQLQCLTLRLFLPIPQIDRRHAEQPGLRVIEHRGDN